MTTFLMYSYTVEWVGLRADGTDDPERRGTTSLHAWGLAVDLNASRNPQGSPPHQDLRLVHVMERHGFSWGGRWPTVPDGMHFEFHGDGPPAADEPL